MKTQHPFFGLTHQGYNNLTTSLGSAGAKKYQYNGKLERSGNPAFAGELQDDYGLDWYDYGARFYDPQLGRFHTVDNSTEKYYAYTPYVYVGNNPLLYIDPDGNDKFKFQAHFKLTSGFLGAGIKALGFKYSFGGTEREISINISFDTDNKLLSIGASSIKREKGAGEITLGGVYGGGETTEKETGTELSAGFNFKSGEFATDSKEIKDKDFKKKGEATIGFFTGSEKEGDGNTFSIGVNPEVNLFLVRTGVGANISVQPDGINKTNDNAKKDNNNEKQEKYYKDEKDNL